MNITQLSTVKDDSEANQEKNLEKKTRTMGSQPSGPKIPARQINFPFTIKAKSLVREATKTHTRESFSKANDGQHAGQKSNNVGGEKARTSRPAGSDIDEDAESDNTQIKIKEQNEVESLRKDEGIKIC